VSDELRLGDQVRHHEGVGVIVTINRATADVVVGFSTEGLNIKRLPLTELELVQGAHPRIDPSAFIAEGAIIRGDVTIGPQASVWFHAVIRGDEGAVTVGEGSNVQDAAVLHSDVGNRVDIGAWVTVGHGAILRGAWIGDEVTIGMNSTIMTGAVIGQGSIVGAASFVPYGAEFPPGSMIRGTPARFVRPVAEGERTYARAACAVYLRLVEGYRSGKWAAPPPQ
jgi:carbonic anhydrase/acetyltransferase-like protein (isoleucine patch superfamily)